MMKKIAIIGGGIAGLTCAYKLSKSGHEVAVFEKDSRLGGHARSYTLENGKTIDLGVFIFHKEAYRKTLELLDELGIQMERMPVRYGFFRNSTLVNSIGNKKLLHYIKNPRLMSPSRLKKMKSIFSFRDESYKDLETGSMKNLTLSQYIDSRKYDSQMVHEIILPVVGFIFGQGSFDFLKELPAELLFRILKDHGVFYPESRFKWYRPKNGTQEYIAKLASAINGGAHLNANIEKIERSERSIVIHHQGRKDAFDYLIFSINPSRAMELIENVSDEEAQILSGWIESPAKVTVHTDTTILEDYETNTGTVNFMFNESRCSTMIDLNSAFGIRGNKKYIWSIDEFVSPKESSLVHRDSFVHNFPVMSSYSKRDRIRGIQGVGRTYYCGSYMGNLLHEGAIVSAFDVVHAITRDIDRPGAFRPGDAEQACALSAE
ncbi:FAD-dependent oxidoreductase [Sorangium sp. So ce269]